MEIDPQVQARALQECREIFGDDKLAQLQTQSYLDVPSPMYPDISYRLQLGFRVQASITSQRRRFLYRLLGKPSKLYLCVYPRREMPDIEFLAEIYVHIRSGNEAALWIKDAVWTIDDVMCNVFPITTGAAYTPRIVD